MPSRLPLLVAFLLAGSAPVLAQDAARPSPLPREIVVTGTGEASAVPDIAAVNLSVLRTAATAREAVDGGNTTMTAVIAGMKELGIQPRDLQTAGFGITPQYRYDNDSNGVQKPPELVGYEARNELMVRVRDLARLGDVLDKAVTLGVNSGGDIAFDNDDPTKLRIEARQKAVRDADATAKALAEAAGVSLGDIVRIDMRDDALQPLPPPMPRMAMEAVAQKASVPIQAGETLLRATVTVTYSIAR